MTVYAIWREGYEANGQQEPACFLGYGEGGNFVEACRDLERMDKRFAGYYTAHDNKFMACALFENEQDARARYG